MVKELVNLVFTYLQGESGDGDAIIYLRCFPELLEELIVNMREKLSYSNYRLIDEATHHFMMGRKMYLLQQMKLFLPLNLHG